MPVEPPRSRYAFDVAGLPPGVEALGVGADLEPATLLAAYRSGAFPMPVRFLRSRHRVAWFSPDPRAVLPLDGLRVPRSLRQSARRYRVRVDTAFDEVVSGCADPAREGGWITADVRRAYGRLHRLGWAHSVETWAGDRLVGGLYGVAVGGLFAGESMYSRERDASKVALVALVEMLRADDPADADGGRLLDVQWQTPHLASLGCVEVPRAEYLVRLRRALRLPPPAAFSAAGAL